MTVIQNLNAYVFQFTPNFQFNARPPPSSNEHCVSDFFLEEYVRIYIYVSIYINNLLSQLSAHHLRVGHAVVGHDGGHRVDPVAIGRQPDAVHICKKAYKEKDLPFSLHFDCPSIIF